MTTYIHSKQGLLVSKFKGLLGIFNRANRTGLSEIHIWPVKDGSALVSFWFLDGCKGTAKFEDQKVAESVLQKKYPNIVKVIGA